MTRRTIAALAVLLSGCLYAAPAAAQGAITPSIPTISCQPSVPGATLCAIGASIKIVPDTVKVPFPVHDTVPVPVNHFCVLKTTWDCSALSAPVVTPPPPPPPPVTPPPAPPAPLPSIGHDFRQVTADSPVTKGSYYLSHVATLGGPWSSSTATAWVKLLNSYNGCACGYDSGNLQWQTDLTGKSLGFYVDTIVVSLSDKTKPIFVDSIHLVSAGTAPIVPPPPPPSSGGSSPAPPPPPPPPPPFLTSPLPAHPRVWMTPTRLAQLKAQATANTSRWQVVKAVADASVARGATYASPDEWALPALCATYLGTGTAAYATRAGVILAASATEANNVQGDSGYAYRFNLPDYIMALDWCYAGLTVAQRHQAATWLMNRADWVWPETNPSRTGGWGLWPSNNYYWGFMMTGPAAIAAAGDDTITTAPVSGPDRPAYHRALAMQHWNLVAVPYLAGEGAGGAWDEGTNYGAGSQWSLGRFVDAYATSGTPIANSWLSDALRWGFASMMPGGKFKAPFGDQARESDAAEYQYDRDAALDLLGAVNDPTLAAQVQTYLGMIGNVPTSDDGTAKGTDELIHFNPGAASAQDLSALPKCFLAAGAGYSVCRTSWTDPNALAWTFQAGNVGDGHNSLAANSLMIWSNGGWVTATANIYSASGIEQDSKNYNTMTIGDSGQKLYGGNNATLVERQVSDSLVVLRAQAGNTYGYPWGTAYGRSIATDYLRTVVFVAPSTFVIVDHATAYDSTKQKVWRWQMHGTPTIAGNTFSLANDAGTAKCAGMVLLLAVTLGIQSMIDASGNPIGSHAVTVSPVGQRPTDLVVTVLQCGAPQAATASDGAAATTIMVGTRRVTVPHDPTAAVTSQ
jgi:hypothetical protein